MRDASLQYIASNLSTILIEWKEANAGMGTFVELCRRLTDAGLPEYSDVRTTLTFLAGYFMLTRSIAHRPGGAQHGGSRVRR